MAKPKLLLFDVNETLLDLSNMAREINGTFGHGHAFKKWFSLLLQYSLVDNLTGHYHDFSAIGAVTLQMLSEMEGKNVPPEKQQELLNMLYDLPPHPDVEPGLERLKAAGYRLATLTNSPNKVVKHQMQHNKLDKYFEAVLSVDDMQLYKPQLQTYKMAMYKLGTQPEHTMMVAAHGWDVAGATLAGLQTAFISRPGQAIYPLAPSPTLQAASLTALADKLEQL